MISSKLIRAARVLLDWDQRTLADRSGVSLPTIQRMEKLGPERSSYGNTQKVQSALESAGVEFTNGDAPGVRLRPAPVDYTDGVVRALRAAHCTPDDAVAGGHEVWNGPHGPIEFTSPVTSAKAANAILARAGLGPAFDES